MDKVAYLTEKNAVLIHENSALTQDNSALVQNNSALMGANAALTDAVNALREQRNSKDDEDNGEIIASASDCDGEVADYDSDGELASNEISDHDIMARENFSPGAPPSNSNLRIDVPPLPWPPALLAPGVDPDSEKATIGQYDKPVASMLGRSQ